MVRFKSITLLSIMLLLLTGCLANTSQADLPTLVAFPTETATDIPTETQTVTATSTQTVTPSPTASHTATRTPSPSPTRTRLPSSTPTTTHTFTPTATATPPFTPTPIPTRTPDSPIIDVFQANKTVAENGEPILLRWVVQADAAILEGIDSSGNLLFTSNVTLVGTYNTNTPPNGNVVTYRLTATRGVDEVRSIVTIDLQSSCTVPWFFSPPPTGSACANANPISFTITLQQFQNGFMFASNSSGVTRICAVQFNLNRYSCFASETYTGTPPVTPPTGFVAPDPLFEDVFYTELATGGLWYDVIGFATTPATVLNIQTQSGSDGRTYYQFPMGIYPFDSNLTGISGITGAITQ